MLDKAKKFIVISLIFFMSLSSCMSFILKSSLNQYNIKDKSLYSNISDGQLSWEVSNLNNKKINNLKAANNKIELNIYNELDDEDYSSMLSNSVKDINYLKQLYVNTGDINYIYNMINICYLISSICRNFGYISFANEYFNTANSLIKHFNLPVSPYTQLVESQYYYLNKQYKDCESIIIKALNNSEKEGDENAKLLSLINLSRVEIKLNNLNDAKINLNEISNNLNYLNKEESKSQFYYCYGELYYQEKNYEEAIKYFKKALEINSDEKNYSLRMSILNELGNSYSALGYFKLSSNYYSEYIKTNGLYVQSCEGINTTVLNSIKNSNPRDLLNQIIVSKSKGIFGIILTVLILVLIILIIFILKYVNKKKKMKLLNEAISKDYLTGAYNRSYMMKKLNFFKNHKKPFIVVMIDIDDYKLVNDNYGHLFGDRVLIDVVETMKKLLDYRFVIGRYGGEEFLIIAQVDSLNVVIEEMNKLRLKINELSWENGHRITISAGISVYEESFTIEGVLDEADNLLYKAKKLGKNRVEY